MTDRRIIEDILKLHRKELEERFKVKKIGIFGSYLRGEQRKRSDLDLLVDFKEVPGLLGFLELEEFLTEITGLKVDLVMRGGLKPGIEEHILREVLYI